MAIYERSRGHAKACAALLVCVAALTPAGAAAQRTHVIRLEVDAARDVHRFVPARITVSAGDRVVFRVSTGAPHVLAFEPAGLSATTRALLQTALIDRSSDLQGPVLPRNGMDYEFIVPRLPAGVYRFYSTPHRAYEMRGDLIVK